MQSSNSSPPPAPPEAAVGSSPLLSSNSICGRLIRSRLLIRHAPSLQTAARFFGRANVRRMMLRKHSVQVRETAAEQLEERQSGWASSKPVVMLDICWNMAILVIGVTVLGQSVKETPCVPLRLWIVGYLLQGLFHCVCAIVEYRRRRLASSSDLEQNGTWENGSGDSNVGSGSDAECSSKELLQEDDGHRFSPSSFM